jgi:hypothetical protein
MSAAASWANRLTIGKNGTGKAFGNEEGSANSEYSNTLKKITDIYRMQGVAGLNPWSGERNQIMPPVAVRPIDFHSNFFTGATTTRRMVVFNDAGRNYDNMSLQARVTVGDTTVWQSTMPAAVTTGTFKTFDLPVAVPASTQPQKAVLTVRLRHARGEFPRHVETIYLMPAARWNSNNQGIVLLDCKRPNR